ncbi:5878_t:CDS:2, partial [Funneliformis mosseae]
YDDNTIVVHIFRPDLSYKQEDGKLWVDKYLSFRTIYPDGTVVPVDISLDIQDFNYCLLDVNGILTSAIEIFPVKSKFLLVTYAEVTFDDPFTINERAMVVDFNGKIYGNIAFEPAYVNVSAKQWLLSRAEIFVNFNPDRGFLRLSPITNTTDYIWQLYILTDEGNIQILVQDFLSFSNSNNLIVTAVPMVDEGFAIVYANSTVSGTIITNPFTSQGGIYAIILEYGKVTKRELVVLYQTSIQGFLFTNINCDTACVELRQRCIVTAKFTFRDVMKTFYLKVDFLSSGAVYNIKPLMIDIQPIPKFDQYNIRSLPFGGYLLSGLGNVDDQIVVSGYIFNENNEYYSWDLPNPTVSNLPGISTILKNNTYVLSHLGRKRDWTLITSDLYRFEKERDHGYYNLHIDTTFPRINDIISSDTRIFTIKYYDKVDLSLGNITIFHDCGNKHKLRQIVSGTNKNYVSLDRDEITVRVYIVMSILKPGE